MSRSQLMLNGREATIEFPEPDVYPKHPVAIQSELLALKRFLYEIATNTTLTNEQRMKLAMDALGLI